MLLAAVWVVVRVVETAVGLLLAAWPVLVVAAVGGGVLLALRERRRAAAARVRAAMIARLRITLADLDSMGDKSFEFALSNLLIRDGWRARVVGGTGDQSADVIGDHERWGRIVLQAKHSRTGGKVRSAVMYQVNGTAGPVHGADSAVVVTNTAFTRDAMAWGERHRVHWADRDRLRAWAELGTPLHDLLRLPRRRTRFPRKWRTSGAAPRASGPPVPGSSA